MRKLALCVGSFSGGGAERVMVTLANKLYEWGYPIDFIVMYDDGPYKKDLNPKINKIVLSNRYSKLIIKRFFAFINLWKYFRNGSADVLMCTIRRFNLFVSFVKMLSFSKTTLILREADTFYQEFENKGYKNKIKLYLLKFFYENATKVIANSNKTCEDLQKFLKLNCSHIQIIYNPIDINKLYKLSYLNKKNFYPTIVSCGRFVPKKNFKDLISSFPMVLKKYPHAKLIIIGEGSEKENIQAQINRLELSECVTLTGFVDNPFYYFASSHVFVQTSLSESFGYVLAEAMACGTPVVAYDSHGAMREILANGKYGELVPIGDLKSLSEAIIRQLENPTPREMLFEAVKKFDINNICKKYLQTLLINNN